MIRTNTRIKICVTLLTVNLIFIWGNSLLPGEISGALSDWLKDLLTPLFGWEGGGSGKGGLLRKVTHFTEFACLGVCLRWFWGMLNAKRLKSFLFALACAFAVACIDETIQIFIPLRGPGIKDVCIDTAGALTGITILTLSHWLKTKSLEETKL